MPRVQKSELQEFLRRTETAQRLQGRSRLSCRRVAADSGCDAGLSDRKTTRLNSSHQIISYAVFCLKKKKITKSGHLRSRGAAGRPRYPSGFPGHVPTIRFASIRRTP